MYRKLASILVFMVFLLPLVGAVNVEVQPDDVSMDVGDTSPLDLVVEGADNGVGAYTVNVSLEDSTAAIIDATVAGEPGLQDVTVAEGGSFAYVEVAYLDNPLPAEGGSTAFLSVEVEGSSEGETPLSVDLEAIGDEEGMSYDLESVSETTLQVGDRSGEDVDDEVEENQTDSDKDMDEGQIESDNVDTVILASTENYPDALVGSAAAAKIGSPVLLTEKEEVPEDTLQTMQELDPSEVKVVGGPAVVSSDVVSSLEEDYNVTRLWGTTRYGSAVEVADHFWVEGAEEAVLVQNGFEDVNGRVLASAKELAQEGEKPVYLTPEGSVPAVVLSSLDDLGVEEVTVVGTEVSDSYIDSLAEVNVSVDEEITGESEEQVRERVQERVEERVNASMELLVVATGNYQHSIAASSFPNTVTYHISAEEHIERLVKTVQSRNVSSVKVAGRPVLAEEAAETLREDTDAEVNLVVARASEAVRMNSNLTRGNAPEFVKANKKRMGKWAQERERAQEGVRERANRSLQKAEDLLPSNASEEMTEELEEARQLFQEGKYIEAQEEATEIAGEVRERSFERNRGNYTALQEQMQEEVEDLQERVQDLREMNREFAEELQENMTTEERLETIEEFRNERKGTVREMMKKAREMGPGQSIGKKLGEAREDMEMEEQQCKDQIQAAKEAFQGQVCTQQTQMLECPEEDDITYQARDGCEISYLQGEGWEAVDGEELEESGEEEEEGSEEEEGETEEDNVVTYSSDGFSPQTITVEEGEEVTWESQGPSMWVAVDQHPTHTQYDGTNVDQHCDDGASETFDSCQSRQTYRFEFEKPGTWNYHNHLSALHTGTVVVEE